MVNLFISLLVTVLCLYYGIIYENTVIITFGYVLGILIIFSVIEVIYRLITIKCSVEIPVSVVEKREPVSIGIRIRNKGGIPSGRVDFRVRIRSSMEEEGKECWFTAAETKSGSRRHDFRVMLYDAGSYDVELLRVRIFSTFGLFHMKKKCKDYGCLWIMPEVFSTALEISEATKNFLGDADVYDTSRPGHDPSEVHSIREYVPKDRLQSVHWKLSAKMDELIVKENSLPRACAIVLLMDMRWLSTNMGERVAAFLDMAASISFCMVDKNCPHYIAWFSKETKDIRRIRVDDDESYYLFWTYYLKDCAPENQRNLRAEYYEKYKNEWCLHDITLNNKLQIYQDGILITKLDEKKIEDECEKLELIL